MKFLCRRYCDPSKFDTMAAAAEEAENLDDAVRTASLHPAARWGEPPGLALEVRPIEAFERLPDGAEHRHVGP